MGNRYLINFVISLTPSIMDSVLTDANKCLMSRVFTVERVHVSHQEAISAYFCVFPHAFVYALHP